MKKMAQGMAEAQRGQGARVVEEEQMLQLLQVLQNHHYYPLLQNQIVPSLSEVAPALEQPLCIKLVRNEKQKDIQWSLTFAPHCRA